VSDNRPKRPLFDSRMKTERDYWLKRLGGEPVPTGVHPDFERAGAGARRPGRLEVAVPDELRERLMRLTNGAPLLVYAAVLAGLQVCLSRHARSTTVIAGSPAPRAAEPNALAILSEVDERTPFRQLLLDVRATLDEAYANASYPFGRVVRDLGLTAAVDRCPLFDVALAHEALHAPLPELNNDITITLRPSGDALVCDVDYHAGLFHGSTVEAFVRHLLTLTSAALADVDRPVGELDMTNVAERQQLLVDWNDTRRDYPHDRAVHELFEEQTAATPDAPAVVCGSEVITYEQLNRRANRLAHRLRALGAGPEVCVGICLERSPELIVGMLAVLKAGGVYVPLDTEYPRERLAFMLEDTRARLLLTREEFVGLLPAGDARVVRVEEAGAGDELSDQNPPAGASADNLVYVMYTSGSTGEPKGVAVTHRGVVRLVKSANYVRLGPGEVVLQFATTAFDASTFEVWGALLNGACLAVAPPPPLGLEELGAFVRGAGVTTLWLTAGLFHQVAEGGLGDFRGVRQLLAGGDVLSAPHVRRALEAVPSLALINGYGPTECTTFACCHVMRAAGEVGSAVPIGRPITNTDVYVLDVGMRPAPVGVVGELYIGGPGLARGYVNRPELTAERFVPHQFSKEPGARLYRTGDAVRYLHDGTIEFIGRGDRQVKVRGFRVELGEVEAALLQCPGVRDTVVTARADQSGDKTLTAYLVADEGATLMPQEVRAHMEQRLPAYMLPTDYLFLPELPLNRNGKVDRARLPAPERNRRDPSERFVAPRTETERRVAEVWCEVLGLDAVGVNDNFFRLGGHSLLATKVMTRLREIFEVELSLGHIFETPTVAELAALVERSTATAGAVAGGGIERVPRGEEDLAQVLAELSRLSEVEVQSLLAQEGLGADGTSVNE